MQLGKKVGAICEPKMMSKLLIQNIGSRQVDVVVVVMTTTMQKVNKTKDRGGSGSGVGNGGGGGGITFFNDVDPELEKMDFLSFMTTV